MTTIRQRTRPLQVEAAGTTAPTPAAPAAAPAPVRVRTRGSVATRVQDQVRRQSGEVLEEAQSTEHTTLRTYDKPAHVTVGGRVTKNMGNYESIVVNVSLTMPCEATEEAIDAMYARCSAWVEQKLENELALATGHQPT